MSLEADDCDDILDFYDEHDRHRIEAERKLLDGKQRPPPAPATSTPSSTPEVPNPSTSSASSNARKRREPPDSDFAEVVAVVDKRPRRPGAGGDGPSDYSFPSSSSSSLSSGTVVNGGLPEGGDVASVSGLLVLSGAAAGVTPRSVESSEPIYYYSSDSGSESNGVHSGGETTPTRPRLRAEVSTTRRREPCRARRQLDFSQDGNDRIVPSFWDRED